MGLDHTGAANETKRYSEGNFINNPTREEVLAEMLMNMRAASWQNPDLVRFTDGGDCVLVGTPQSMGEIRDSASRYDDRSTFREETSREAAAGIDGAIHAFKARLVYAIASYEDHNLSTRARNIKIDRNLEAEADRMIGALFIEGKVDFKAALAIVKEHRKIAEILRTKLRPDVASA